MHVIKGITQGLGRTDRLLVKRPEGEETPVDQKTWPPPGGADWSGDREVIHKRPVPGKVSVLRAKAKEAEKDGR